MVHNNQRIKSKSINKSHKIGNSTNVINTCSQPTIKHFGSSVAIHKLRESKWFNHNESNIVCSVVESGFILEKRLINNNSESEWGVACWDSGKGKKFIFLLSIY